MVFAGQVSWDAHHLTSLPQHAGEEQGQAHRPSPLQMWTKVTGLPHICLEVPITLFSTSGIF